MLKLKIDEAGHSVLPEAIQGEYELKDGSYYLKTEDENAMSALQAERKLRSEAEAKLKATADKFAGLDAEKIREILNERETAEQKLKIKEGKFEELLQEKELTFNERLKAEEDKRREVERDYLEKEVKSVITDALLKNGAIAEDLDDARLLIMQHVEFERIDGETVIRFKDDDGFAQRVKPEDFIKKWKEKKGKFFKATMKSGSGGRNDNRDLSGGGNQDEKIRARERLKRHYEKTGL